MSEDNPNQAVNELTRLKHILQYEGFIPNDIGLNKKENLEKIEHIKRLILEVTTND